MLLIQCWDGITDIFSESKAYSCGWKVGKVNNPGQKKQMAKVWYQAGVDARKKRWEEFRKAGVRVALAFTDP
jgi:hypothetical protein